MCRHLSMCLAFHRCCLWYCVCRFLCACWTQVAASMTPLTRPGSAFLYLDKRWCDCICATNLRPPCLPVILLITSPMTACFGDGSLVIRISQSFARDQIFIAVCENLSEHIDSCGKIMHGVVDDVVKILQWSTIQHFCQFFRSQRSFFLTISRLLQLSSHHPTE